MIVLRNDIFQVLDGLFSCSALMPEVYETYKQPLKTCTSQKPAASCAQTSHPKNSGFWCPEIKRVTFNGDTTIVFFADNTYAIVKCSAGDKYDRKTAITYAIVKRLLGKLGAYDKNGKFHANEVDGSGFGTYLQKIVDNGFDQQLEEQTASEKKRRAKQEHEQRQAAQKQAAFEKRVEERAKQILLERAAIDRANKIEDDKRASQEAGGCLDNQCTCSKKAVNNKNSKKDNDILKEYVRPDKPFAEFTPYEKHEYWKYHNAKRKNKK